MRGHLDSIKRLMVGDIYVVRGSRQRHLTRGRWCNYFKVCTYGRTMAIQRFSDLLWADPSTQSCGRSLADSYASVAQSGLFISPRV